MIVYGINFSEQIEQNKGKFTGGAVTAAVAGMGTNIGLGAANFSASLALAPFTGGTSLIWGFASAGAAGAGC
jgi:hypothetical protein